MLIRGIRGRINCPTDFTDFHRFIIFYRTSKSSTEKELPKVQLKKIKKKGKTLDNTEIYANFAKNKLAGFKSKAKNKDHKYQKNDKER